MRAVFINHCHPDTPHVCAIRMREFAKAMAARGHKIILLTETLYASPEAASVSMTEKQLDDHDFTFPFYMAAPPVGFPLLNMLRKGQLIWGIRQFIIFWSYKRHRGVLTNWRRGCQPYLDLIASKFSPDAIWSTFGGTDCWNIAQDLASKSGCAWVADIKDLWGTFIPWPFRSSLAQSYCNAVAMTTFSKLHKLESEVYFPMDKYVLYSGFNSYQINAVTTVPSDQFFISITGSIYNPRYLDTVLLAISEWLKYRSSKFQNNFKLIYAGTENNEVNLALKRVNWKFKTEINNYLDPNQYFAILAKCNLNIYLRSDGRFHHKIFELLAIGKPIMCFPAESVEVIDLFDEVGGKLFNCQSFDNILTSLESLGDRLMSTRRKNKQMAKFQWDHQVEILENVLGDAIRN